MIGICGHRRSEFTSPVTRRQTLNAAACTALQGNLKRIAAVDSGGGGGRAEVVVTVDRHRVVRCRGGRAVAAPGTRRLEVVGPLSWLARRFCQSRNHDSKPDRRMIRSNCICGFCFASRYRVTRCSTPGSACSKTSICNSRSSGNNGTCRESCPAWCLVFEDRTTMADRFKSISDHRKTKCPEGYRGRHIARGRSAAATWRRWRAR